MQIDKRGPAMASVYEEELLALFLFYTSRLEARLEKKTRPAIRRAMLEIRSLIEEISPTGQFRIFEWQQLQPLTLPILSTITSILREQLPIELQTLRAPIQKAAANYIDKGRSEPELEPISNDDLMKQVTIAGVTLYSILGLRGSSNKFTINMSKDLDRLIRGALFKELPTSDIANKVVISMDRKGKTIAQIRKGSYANQILNRTNNTISASTWDIANKTARNVWSNLTPSSPWMWLATLENTCPLCLPYHRKTVGSLKDFPYLPKVHPNCRCIVVPVV